MSQIKIHHALIILSFVFLSAVSAKAQSLSGSIGGGTVERGKTSRGVLILNIPDGLHVNTNRPNSPYAIPTTARLSGRGLKISGPFFPKGKSRRFEFSKDTINVYEGTVRLPFTVTVPANFRGNSISVRAVVRYQACTDEVCYPPRTAEITITARVR